MFAQGINIFESSIPKVFELTWQPQEGKQTLAYNYITSETIDVLCYGGARGGGKSELGIGYTLKRMLRLGSKFNGLYLRNTSTELEDIVSRMLTMLDNNYVPYKFNSQKNILNINGARLKMFYTEGRGLDALQGSNINHAVIEEPQLMANLETVMLKIYSLLRTSDKTAPVKMLLLCNPLGAGTQYLKRHFVDYGENNIVTNEKKKRQVFVKATVFDNPLLLENDPTYLDNLNSLPDEMRKAWLEGDFNVLSGVALPISKEKHAKELEIPYGSEFFCSLDWGFKSKTAIGFYAILYTCEGYEKLYKFKEIILSESQAEAVAAGLKKEIETLENQGFYYLYLVVDPSIYGHNNGQSVADYFVKYNLKLQKANNDRSLGLHVTHNWLLPKKYNNSGNEEPRLVVSPKCKDFWSTVPYLVLEENDYKVAKYPKQDDHSYDETRYAVMSRNITKKVINS